MHGHLTDSEFTAAVAGFLGGYYLLLAAMNLAAAARQWRTAPSRPASGWGRFRPRGMHLWLLLAAVFTISSWLAFQGTPGALRWVVMPAAAKDLIDRLLSPTWFMLGLLVLLIGLYLGRRLFVQPPVAWLLLNLALWAMGASLGDPDFVKTVGKPDNVAIVGMLYLLGFFTWLSTYRAVQNDERLARGEPPLEAMDNEPVLVWPDLVYIELICMVAVTVLLIVWAIALPAPLEDPANPAVTPNPSKAPWYFLGLQELLVYFDPWLAGVVLPGLILLGLLAIPYLDVNPAGSGYYTIAQRPFAYATFQLGFVGLWIGLIVLGTFFRGPGWNFFGIYESWDPHKSVVAQNVNLSDWFWTDWLGRQIPAPPPGGSRAPYILLRELPGLALAAAYFLALPLGLVAGSRFFRGLYRQMGRWRFVLMMFLLLMMALVPIKMIVNWTWDLKYVIAMPEWSLNL